MVATAATATVTAELAGAMNACLAVGEQMAGRGAGVIVNVMSIAALQHERGSFAESTLAGGLRSLTEALGVEWAASGPRVVGVAWGGLNPGNAARLPSRDPGTDDDVASAVLFVAGSDASFLTAETLIVDGGWSAYHMF